MFGDSFVGVFSLLPKVAVHKYAGATARLVEWASCFWVVFHEPEGMGWGWAAADGGGWGAEMLGEAGRGA